MNSTNLKPKVDTNLCIGCSLCPVLAEKSFEMVEINGEHKAREILPAGDTNEALSEARDACPVDAISLDS